MVPRRQDMFTLAGSPEVSLRLVMTHAFAFPQREKRSSDANCRHPMSAGRLAETQLAQGFLGGTVAVVVDRLTVGDVVVVVERAIVDGGGTGLVCSDGCCGL
jgi:hypothetical protein